jgi:hypothetical protein
MCVICSTHSHYLKSIIYNAYNTAINAIINTKHNIYMVHIIEGIKEQICNICIANIRYHAALINAPKKHNLKQFYNIYNDINSDLNKLLQKTNIENSLYSYTKKNIDSILCNMNNNINIIKNMCNHYGVNYLQ